MPLDDAVGRSARAVVVEVGQGLRAELQAGASPVDVARALLAAGATLLMDIAEEEGLEVSIVISEELAELEGKIANLEAMIESLESSADAEGVVPTEFTNKILIQF